MTSLWKVVATSIAVVVLALLGDASHAAAPVKVELATPSTGEQGTLELDVVITGSGFEAGAVVDFLVTGSNTDTGNVVVKGVTFHDSKKLTAKVSLENAKLADFDIKVTLMSGRNGKGITLFKVLAKGGGNGDTVPPATIGDLGVTPTIRALTLAFTATGDDGNSGTAMGYDVRYRAGTDCYADDPQTWIRAARSAEIVAEAPGTLDYFDVRGPQGLSTHGLSPGTDYCVAVRVLDEVNRTAQTNWWARAQTATLPGAWSLTAIPVAAAGATAQHALMPRLTIDPDDPTHLIGGWGTADIVGNTTGPGALRFAMLSTNVGSTADEVIPNCSASGTVDCVEVVPSSIWTKYIDTTPEVGSPFLVSFHPIPGQAKVAAFFVRGVKVGSRTTKNKGGEIGSIILERDAAGTWSVVGENGDGVQPLNDPAFFPYSLDGQAGGWSTLAYAKGADGGFRPAMAWRAVMADTRTYQKAVINYAERTTPGWTAPMVLAARETNGGAWATDLFRRRNLFNKPDGTLALIIDGSQNQMHTTYAERIEVSPGQWQWRYYLIDPTRNDNSRIGYDAHGGLMLSYSLYATSQLSVFRQPAAPFWSSQGAPPATPLPSFDFRNPPEFSMLGSWKLVYEDPAYNASVQFPSVYPTDPSGDACGTAHFGATFYRSSGNGLGVTTEVRAMSASATSTYPSEPAADERIDATTSQTAKEGLILPNGDRGLLYEWGYVGGYAVSYSPRPPNFLYLARNATGCSPGG